MTREDQIHRGNEAIRLLAEPLLVEAFDALEASAIEEIVGADASADEYRRHMALKVRVIRELKDALRSVITTGKQAALRSG